MSIHESQEPTSANSTAENVPQGRGDATNLEEPEHEEPDVEGHAGWGSAG